MTFNEYQNMHGHNNILMPVLGEGQITFLAGMHTHENYVHEHHNWQKDVHTKTKLILSQFKADNACWLT